MLFIDAESQCINYSKWYYTVENNTISFQYIWGNEELKSLNVEENSKFHLNLA